MCFEYKEYACFFRKLKSALSPLLSNYRHNATEWNDQNIERPSRGSTPAPAEGLDLVIETRPQQFVHLVDILNRLTNCNVWGYTVDSLNRFTNMAIQLTMRCWWPVCHTIFIYILINFVIVKFSINLCNFKQSGSRDENLQKSEFRDLGAKYQITCPVNK